jgi:hypothetical protein
MHAADRVATTLAARQRGAFARWQLVDAGIDDAAIHRRLATGHWLTVRPGVYELAGLPPDAEQPLWVAWLAVGPDAVVSFEAAAERHGLAPVPPGRLVFTTRHGDHHRLAGVTVHQLRDLLPHHVGEVRGLPTTTVARTIVDLGAVLGVERLRRLVEAAVLERRTTDEAIAVTLGDVARHGKRGMRRVAAVLAGRAPGDPVPDSELERMLLGALRRGGCPEPVPQHPHPGRSTGRGRVDFAYPEARVVLEADGRRWHQRLADMKRDRARDNEAARAGWVTLRFLWEELTHDPDDVARAVLETLAHRTPVPA